MGWKSPLPAARTRASRARSTRSPVAAGWPSLSCDTAFGGQGLPIVLNNSFYEMLNSANQAWTMYPGLSHGAYECLHAHGSEAQKRLYVLHKSYVLVQFTLQSLEIVYALKIDQITTSTVHTTFMKSLLVMIQVKTSQICFYILFKFYVIGKHHPMFILQGGSSVLSYHML